MDNLPPELIDYLMHFLDTPSFLALRATSRGFKTKLDELGKTWHPALYVLQIGKVKQTLFQDKRNVFLTGPGGTGKSTAIRAIHRECIERDINVVCLAPTQCAAQLIPEGRTIHSFLGIKRTLPKKVVIQMLMEYRENTSCHHRLFSARGRCYMPDFIIIDECSMLGSNLCWMLDLVLKFQCNNPKPFGGIQIMMVGDFCQLPPVCDGFCFETEQWNDLDMVTFDLTIPLRQSGSHEWFRYLQDVRHGRITTIDDMIDRVIDQDVYNDLMSQAYKPVLLSSDNKRVNEMNEKEFQKLWTMIDFVSHAEDTIVRRVTVNGSVEFIPHHGAIPAYDPDRFWRTPREISFRAGARYLLTANLNKKHGFINGMCGTYEGNGLFLTDNFDQFPIFHRKYKIDTYYPISSNIYLCRKQYPIRLGWAITIHKSQGMTIPRIIVDLQTLRAAGQYYVAMSRVEEREDVYIINPKAKKIPISGKVLCFYGYAQKRWGKYIIN